MFILKEQNAGERVKM